MDSHQGRGSFSILWGGCIITCVMLFMMLYNTDSKVETSTQSCVGVASVFLMLIIIYFLRRLLLSGVVQGFKELDLPQNRESPWYGIGAIAIFCYLAWHHVLHGNVIYSVTPFVLTALIGSLWLAYKGDVPIEINESMKDMPTIGEVWANSCCDGYYKELFKDFRDRLRQFEKNHEGENGSFVIELKKMLILIPLSCNVRGTLDQRDPAISYQGDLPVHIDAQGANVNRKYMNPVYRLTSRTDNHFVNVCVEEPNTLRALEIYSQSAPDKIWKFQRDEFISNLRYRLADQPCRILLYDDLKKGPRKSLNDFLVQAVKNILEEEARQYIR